jgi:hypothetical protein
MYSFREASKAYAQWVDTLIFEFVDRHRQASEDHQAYIQENGLFVTFSFDQRAIRRRQSASDERPTHDQSPEFFNVDRFYKRLCRVLLGSNYARKVPQQPLMVAVADVNGTRYFNRPESLDNTHIHAICIFQKHQIGKFADLRECSLRNPSFEFRDIHAEPKENMKMVSNRPSNLSLYATKFLASNSFDVRMERDLQIYPCSESALLRMDFLEGS